MTDPNPLREDEVRKVARAICEARCVIGSTPAKPAPWSSETDQRAARAAITALDQVRENRGASPQQQAYETQSPLGIVPLPGYPVDQVREGRGRSG